LQRLVRGVVAAFQVRGGRAGPFPGGAVLQRGRNGEVLGQSQVVVAGEVEQLAAVDEEAHAPAALDQPSDAPARGGFPYQPGRLNALPPARARHVRPASPAARGARTAPRPVTSPDWASSAAAPRRRSSSRPPGSTAPATHHPRFPVPRRAAASSVASAVVRSRRYGRIRTDPVRSPPDRPPVEYRAPRPGG